MENETFTLHYHLTAGECDATGHIPVTGLTERLIEVATEHANLLGIGYSTLIKSGISWVLTRLSIEMTRYPGINDEYSITTWIEAINRRFSERNMLIRDGSGEIIGYARTVWVAIDVESRGMGDLSCLQDIEIPVSDTPCPMAKHPKLVAPGPDALEFQYTFRYLDLDFNRHVNTVRYIDLILNRWPLEHYDTHSIARIDISFSHECYFGETVLVRADQGGDVNHCELLHEGRKMVASRIMWRDK